jgi:cytochrome c-type biogenesis protein CcmH
LPSAGRGSWRGFLFLLLLTAFLFPLASQAAQAPRGPHSLPPKLQQRYQHLTEELRCPTCQNEAIGTSQAKIAANLRRTVRQKLLAGKTDQQIRDYMISRYGLFAVYDPPMTGGTWLLWFGPLILLAIAALTGFLALRRRRRLLDKSSRQSTTGAAEEGAGNHRGGANR